MTRAYVAYRTVTVLTCRVAAGAFREPAHFRRYLNVTLFTSGLPSRPLDRPVAAPLVKACCIGPRWPLLDKIEGFRMFLRVVATPISAASPDDANRVSGFAVLEAGGPRLWRRHNRYVRAGRLSTAEPHS
jgi:hypothetical protein